MGQSAQGDWASLLSAFNTLLAAENTESIVRRAVELARSRIGLQRVGLYLVDEAAQRMIGTWGTSFNGELVDEHQAMFELNDGVLDVFRRAEAGGPPFTVLDNCPIVAHQGNSSQVAGRGWVACIPIRSARARIGMMFNDSGLSGAPIDEGKQGNAAILCSLLGSMIELLRAQPGPNRGQHAGIKHPVVQKALAMLSSDPGLAGKQIANSLDVSLSRLVRLFKAEVGSSLVDYRNQLRIERFQALVEAGEHNLHDVARAAGFGSYAQFHRVFRAAFGTAPRNYLRVGASARS
jgi:AraC-like DNA-binding protein